MTLMTSDARQRHVTAIKHNVMHVKKWREHTCEYQALTVVIACNAVELVDAISSHLHATLASPDNIQRDLLAVFSQRNFDTCCFDRRFTLL